jgi:hypothetical protein
MVYLDRDFAYTYNAEQIRCQRKAQGVRPGEGILINELAAFKAEVQFDKKDMARSIIDSSHRSKFDSIFFRKNEGIESDTPEQNGRSRAAYTAP